MVGTHHGNERDAAPLSVAFAREVLQTLAKGQGAREGSLANGVYYVFPVLNISGHNRNHRLEMDGSGLWHDPNRDYPDACVDNKYFKLRSTSLIAEFIQRQNIVSAVTIHGYIGTFTYPWGFYTENPETPDHDIYHKLLTYAAEANHYRIGNHKDVIYPATGSFEDWAYHDHGVWVALLEMKYNLDYGADVESLIRFFMAAPREKSLDHAHYGQCSQETIFRHFNRGRP